MRKLLLRNFQSPGDIVMLTAAVRDLHRCHPAGFLTDVRTSCPDLWDQSQATIGRMANTISHDLRHPLTAIQAYAEFLEERDLTETQRKDFFQEIRIAVNHMLDEINQLLGFSHERQALGRVDGRLDEVVDRAIKTVKALPEFEKLTITSDVGPECQAWFDPGKVNACC